MKKTVLKRIACAVLSAILILTPVVSGYAAGIEAKIPIVHVRGVGEEIYKNPGTDKQEAVFPPSTKAILKLVGQLSLPLGKLAATRDWDAFAYSLADAINVFFADFACNPDGTSKENVGIDWSYPEIKEHYTKGDTYTFSYDWRLDPYEIAAQLNDFIDYVIEGTGCKKVSINAHSMGGIITATYISVYGCDKLYSVVMDSTAVLGGSVAGEPFSGKIEINDVALTRTINQVLPANEVGEFIESILNLLLKAGVIGGITDAAEYIVDKVIDILYEESLAQIFATSPGVWSLITAAEYDAAKELLLKDTELYGELIEKIDRYHNNVRLKAADILQSVLDSGTILVIISKYNLQVPPVIESWNISTDGVLDSASTSFGATFAPLGETLGWQYKQAVKDGHCHVSPDLKVDASTCLFPEYTWFIKNLSHSEVPDDLTEMSVTLAYSKTQPDVRTYKEYPQFLTYERDTEMIRPTLLPDIALGDSWFVVTADVAVSTVKLAAYIYSMINSAA